MGILVSWDNEANTVIRADYAGHWTWEEFSEGINEAAEMIRSVSYRVDLIENMKPGTLPVSGSVVNYARNAMRTFPDNLRLLVVVTNPFVRAMGTVFLNLNSEYRKKIAMVDSIDLAYQMLEQSRNANER